jgi:hypothetical protein
MGWLQDPVLVTFPGEGPIMHQFQKRVGPTRRHLLTGFAAVAAAILLTAVLGIWEHVASTYEAGELDFE